MEAYRKIEDVKLLLLELELEKKLHCMVFQLIFIQILIILKVLFLVGWKTQK